jgi:hypothetical protein
MNQKVYSCGDKSVVELDDFIIEVTGKHIKVFERGFIKKMIFDNNVKVKA